MPAATAPKSGHLPVAIGDVVAGKYTVERIVGAGGVGVVVAAKHRDLDERVAIKLLQRSAAESAENVARFAREARAVARIKTEHVARVMDTGTLPSGEPFMVMEYLEGRDLSELLRVKTKLPVAEAVDYVVQACEAIAIAHGLSIVHRDLKPANLFLTTSADGTPTIKVLDFGISKLLDGPGDQAVTQTLSVIGSPLYMSPEQMEHPRDTDLRADIWSLGIILYELITGRPPFEAATLPMLCARICTAPPTPIETHLPGIDPVLAHAVLSCLEKDPTKRPPDVATLAVALGPFGLPRTALAVGRIERIAGRREPSDGTRTLQGSLALRAATFDDPESSIAPRKLAWDSSPPPAARTSSTVRPPSPGSKLNTRGLVAIVAAILLGATALGFLGVRWRASQGASNAIGPSAPTATATATSTVVVSVLIPTPPAPTSPSSAASNILSVDLSSSAPLPSASASAETSSSQRSAFTARPSARPVVSGARSAPPPKIDDVLNER
ncbi:MAG: serine/threonine-protein kinase [Polyangiaceae bacterium]